MCQPHPSFGRFNINSPQAQIRLVLFQVSSGKMFLLQGNMVTKHLSFVHSKPRIDNAEEVLKSTQSNNFKAVENVVRNVPVAGVIFTVDQDCLASIDGVYQLYDEFHTVLGQMYRCKIIVLVVVSGTVQDVQYVREILRLDAIRQCSWYLGATVTIASVFESSFRESLNQFIGSSKR